MTASMFASEVCTIQSVTVPLRGLYPTPNTNVITQRLIFRENIGSHEKLVECDVG
jgi:hypothetical protein